MLYRNMTGSLMEDGFYDTNVADAVLDRDGRMIERHRLDASIAVTWTADGGYFSVGTLPTGNRTGYDTGPYAAGMFHARRFDGAGALAWDRALPGVPCDQVLKVVQSADGGCAVLGQRQNR